MLDINILLCTLRNYYLGLIKQTNRINHCFKVLLFLWFVTVFFPKVLHICYYSRSKDFVCVILLNWMISVFSVPLKIPWLFFNAFTILKYILRNAVIMTLQYFVYDPKIEPTFVQRYHSKAYTLPSFHTVCSV